MSNRKLNERQTRRRADVRNATVLSRNTDGTYQCLDLLTRHEFRAAKANRNDEFSAGTRVVIAPMAAGRIAVGGGNVILSRAPQEQRGVGLFPRGASAQYTSPVVLSMDPNPVQLEQGGASVAATIYGRNLTAAPSYEDSGITDASGPTITSSEIDIDIEAAGTVALGYYDVTVHGVTLTDAIEVVEADTTVNFVAVSSLTVYSSADGETWTDRSPVAGTFRAVTHGNGTWVVVGSSGLVYTSTDGISWTSRTAAASNHWQSVCYGNGLFVAVAVSGTGNRVMTSPDGITWTIRTSAADSAWATVRWSPTASLFIAVAAGLATTANSVMTSPDGVTWTTQTTPAAGYESVADNGTVIVIVGSGKAATSVNGTAWAAQSIDSGSSWLSVTYGGSVFVAGAGAITTGPKIQTSPDGATWTNRTPADASTLWYGAAYGQSKFVMVGASGTNNAQVSADGITWTAGDLPAASSFADVAAK